MRTIHFTLREIIVATLIILLMIGLGYPLANKVHNHAMERDEVYLKALKISAPQMFDYALQTNVGHVLAEGTVKGLKPVTHPYIDGEYYYIEEIEQHYVEKSRQVSYKCGDKTCWKTETYWEWDDVGRDWWQVDTVEFLGRQFSPKQIRANIESYHSTVTESHYVRYEYYTIPVEFNGVLFAKTVDNNIQNTEFHYGKTLDVVIAEKEKSAESDVLLFWLLWMILAAIIAIGFMVLENKYLNGFE